MTLMNIRSQRPIATYATYADFVSLTVRHGHDACKLFPGLMTEGGNAATIISALETFWEVSTETTEV